MKPLKLFYATLLGTLVILTVFFLLYLLANSIPKQTIAVWPPSAFKSKKLDSEIEKLLGMSKLVSTKLIKIDIPDNIQKGIPVTIKIMTNLPKVDNINILINKNSSPLAATYNFPAGSVKYIETRIKIETNSNITVVARSKGQLYYAVSKIYVDSTKQ